MKPKQRLTAICVSAALAASLSLVALDASARAKPGGGKPPPPPAPSKFLIGWASDQMLDGNNCSALDTILALPGDPANCHSLLPDADFIMVIDATPGSATYGKVVNTAEMPAVYGQHLLSVTENFVDNALDLAIGLADPQPSGLTANPNGIADDDILGGVPNFNPGNGLPSVVPAPSSVLNEAHHHSVYPTIDNGNVYNYYGGIISANIFGCDITDPMNIKPAPNTQKENIGLHIDNVTNLCGLAISGAVYNKYSGTDDLDYNPKNGHYFTTMMGAGGGYEVGPSLPPVLTTPGGLQEYDPATGMVWEHSSIPANPVFGHGTFTGDGPKGTGMDIQGFYANAAPGEMLGPKRYAPRVDSVNAGVDGNGMCAGPASGGTFADGTGATAIDGVTAFNLCVPGVAPFNQLGGDTGAVNLTLGINEGPDTGLLTHPHGIGVREDLQGQIADKDGNIIGTSDGIIMISDYADPVSLALGGSGIVGANNHNLGTTIRLFDLAHPEKGPYQVIQMPDGNRHEGRASMEEPEGLMAMRTTHGSISGSKGAFVASMCGGSIFYSPDITVPKPEFRLVYDFGTCVGASVFTLTKDDNFMFLPISGIQVDGDPTFDRDYKGEHERRIAILDLRKMMAKGNDINNLQCDKAPAFAYANVPYFLAKLYPILMSPLGQGITLGAGIFPYYQPGDMHNGGRYWPNNSASDCPYLVDEVNYGGVGEDGVLGTADDHPDNVTSRGGPHFTVHDADDQYIATSAYFVDLRNYAIKDVGLLLEALGLGQAWCDPDISANTSTTTYFGAEPNGHSHPPGGPNDGDYPAGGLGNIFDALGVPGVPGATDCAGTGQANILPGTGSVGDDTVCMMKWNRTGSDLALDPTFNAGDPTSPTGCIDLDFGDTGAKWPANGARNPGAGNAKTHAMSFYDLNNGLRFFTNGTGYTY